MPWPCAVGVPAGRPAGTPGDLLGTHKMENQPRATGPESLQAAGAHSEVPTRGFHRQQAPQGDTTSAAEEAVVADNDCPSGEPVMEQYPGRTKSQRWSRNTVPLMKDLPDRQNKDPKTTLLLARGQSTLFVQMLCFFSQDVVETAQKSSVGSKLEITQSTKRNFKCKPEKGCLLQRGFTPPKNP